METLNEHEHSPVILLAAITSRKTDRIYPFEALIEPPEGGLSQRSNVLLIELRALDKKRVVGRLGSVSPPVMNRVDAALRIATGLVRI
ncbi:MAG: type II toxin-antitoxin system PemK/MazF family toxin [Acidobacteria bacterium]|nr:type II toxin-antitoxin system PemK/MazF family toxin [Acidobacteriota bacterium]